LICCDGCGCGINETESRTGGSKVTGMASIGEKENMRTSLKGCKKERGGWLAVGRQDIFMVTDQR
jgi:hypothetical protein